MIDMTLPRIEALESGETYGKYEVQPLEPGYGITLGNALRRVLLASLPGAAVTSIKIDGVYHEFSDIPNIKEDVTELILNTKKIRVKSFSEDPVMLRLDVSGQRNVTAEDIYCPSDVEIINKDLHLATLDSKDAHLSMEFSVERGKGYVPSDQKSGLPIGVIPVDAIFTPIEKVVYSTEHTRAGQAFNYDRLLLEIWTDGSMAPTDALQQASEILVEHFKMIGNFNQEPAEAEKTPISSFPVPQKLYDMPIEELDLSTRSYNCLKRSNITKVGQVLAMNEDDLLSVRNFGRKSLDELYDRLKVRGLIDKDHPGFGQASQGA
ncbi:MAG: DNA-directed RNA polymerase subunit alpha [Chloroflexi bacterium]|nr:DNA-directed RNA polymerase subunit alpha [Chloroflexota bacterium]